MWCLGRCLAAWNLLVIGVLWFMHYKQKKITSERLRVYSASTSTRQLANERHSCFAQIAWRRLWRRMGGATLCCMKQEVMSSAWTQPANIQWTTCFVRPPSMVDEFWINPSLTIHQLLDIGLSYALPFILGNFTLSRSAVNWSLTFPSIRSDLLLTRRIMSGDWFSWSSSEAMLEVKYYKSVLSYYIQSADELLM